MAEYRQGVGPDRLPQGAAKALNDAQPGMNPPLDTQIPVQFVPHGSPDGIDYSNDNNEDEEMQVLMSPPDQGYRPPLFRPQQDQHRLPQYVRRHLPTLWAAARQPDAPPALRAAFHSIIRTLEDEEAQGG